MELIDIAIIAIAALAAGAVNSVAGGGTFFSFPALLAIGVPPVVANASNSVSLWPASLAGAWAFRRELARFSHSLPMLTAVAFAGGIGGGLLLLATSNAAFSRLIPWLLLTATLLFAFSRQISAQIRRFRPTSGTENRHHIGAGGFAFQLVVSIYGGFFGAGMGILMIAALAIQGFDDMHEINALKNWLSAVIYSVAVATFTIAGAVSWPHTVVMLITGTLGGYWGARAARRLPAPLIRGFVIAIGAVLTVHYFLRPA
ncbi:sulfite exporter TauE/SafE family protein [Azoarcus sp. L1K30]|uniref:sulfite exporter TauE/SafE family protein n=1 Tax=Azoarcus sp. L1K30 TaxID=2820277 RepID=UPI001B837868|nr:sulfite exporter TauE/SafE family protein [Azoarcus sp. L1K30]MBR0565542.1 sulfite exporter TauE/SafE family protein [Azoarcus sp. L1K30]